jgi:membrane-associated phospholipid phosphatase
MFAVDYATPLIPWTFIIYLSDYLMVPLIVYLTDNKEEFQALCRMCFATLVVCGLIFVFYPTRYPRPPYPAVQSTFVAALMNLIAVADTPNNCFPSMHVAITGIATWSVRHRSPRVFLLFSLWAIAICVSTLTTKQHYLLDIGGGLFVVMAVALVEHLLFERRSLRRQVI